MFGLGWIKTSLLLMQLLHFTASQQQSLSVRGGEAFLSCGNVRKDQNNCESTTWLFTPGHVASVALVELGKINPGYSRLRVTENCSLVIANVSDQDVGCYFCRQYISGEKEGPDSVVHLSVVDMTEREDSGEVTLRCSVSAPEYCGHIKNVKWLYQGNHLDEDNKDLKMSNSPCSASVTFKTSHFIYSSRYKLLRCEVSAGDTVQQFLLQPPTSGDKTTSEKTKPTTEVVTPPGSSPEAPWPYIAGAVVLVLLVLLVLLLVIVLRKKRAGGNKTRTTNNAGLGSHQAAALNSPDSDPADPDGGVSYASVTYTKKAGRRERREDTGEPDHAVTYATVNVPSRDPGPLYATLT